MYNRPQTISGVFIAFAMTASRLPPLASLNSKLNDFQNPTLIRIFPFICIVPFSRTGILLVVFALTTVTQTPARINTVLDITRSYGAVILFCLCNGKASCDSDVGVPNYRYIMALRHHLRHGQRLYGSVLAKQQGSI